MKVVSAVSKVRNLKAIHNKPSVLFQRVGGQLSIPKQGYSGDEIASIIDTRKTDIDFKAMEKLAETEE